MKKILITGGAGFIGSNLINYIFNKKKNYVIYSLDNYSTGSKKNHIISKNIFYIKGSTFNIKRNRILKNTNIDYIFHFAEFARIAPSFKNYDACIKTNTLGTFEVIKFAMEKNAKLIYSASSSTIGKNKYLSPYSWSKYTNNELIKNFSKWFGLEYVLVYFFNVYGNNQIMKGEMAAVIGIFEQQYIENKNLTVAKPGTQKRDFTHVDDIVRGTYMAATKTVNSEFLLASGKSYSILEVAKMFQHKITMINKRPGERFHIISNLNKEKKILKFYSKIHLKSYIKKFREKNSF